MLLLFDLDGTLIDSVADIATASNKLRSRHGLPPLDLVSVAHLVGDGVETLVSRLIGEKDTPTLKEAIEFYRRTYEEHCLDQTVPYPGVEETLHVLRHGPRRIRTPLFLAVISNKLQSFSSKILQELKLLPYFDLVIGGDTVRPMKPDPAPLLYAMRRFSTQPEETWMIGDSPSDVRAGKAAGCRTVAVTYGLRSRELLLGEDPDRVIDRFEDLALVLSER
jgi:phosphoglycolate phosphatase